MEPVLNLLRYEKTNQHSLGVLAVDGCRPFSTLELPWRDNKPHISCIPVGSYYCVPHSGPKFKNTWEVTGVPGRDDVLLHYGNFVQDSTGCILIGYSANHTNGVAALDYPSKDAFQKFRYHLQSMKIENFILCVR